MYKYFNKCIIRTPRLPFGDINRILTNPILLREEKIQESIFLASRTLFIELRKFLNGDLNQKKKKKITYSIYKYITRMCTRPTPFGTFSGITLADISNQTSIIIKKGITRKTRLDMFLLSKIHEALLYNYDIRKNLRFKLNSSIEFHKNRIKYIEITDTINPKYTINEVTIDRSLKVILKNGQTYRSFKDLSAIIEKLGYRKEEVENYLNELINSQILIDELSLYITGNNYLSFLISKLNKIHYNGSFVKILIKIQDTIQQIDNKEILPTDGYNKIETILSNTNINYDKNYLFQVDYYRDADQAQICHKIADQVQEIIPLLSNISGISESTRLRTFKKKFFERYNMQKVPITQALDNEIGIGYGDQNENNMINPLLEKIEFPNNGKSYEKKNNEFSSILLEKYINAKSKNQNEIILHKSDFKQIENLKNTKYPNTIYTLLNILNSENGPLIRLKNFCGSSASIPITRFYHLDKKINSFIKEIINKEEELMVGNPLIAEICHIPQSRVGNILFRPKLRNYEIQFLSNSISKDEFIIGINDLFIYYENDTIKLYSKRLNRQITPILTCAHNYNGSLNLPLYQFLCDLQNQQTKNDFYFSWGYLENILNHMPRVKYKNIILSPEQWYINSESMEYLHKIQSDTLLLDEINKWKDSYFLPSKVLLHEYDNDLLIDFNNILSIRTFLNCIKTKNKFILLEFITSKPEELVKDSNLNGYLNECILFFYKS